MKSRDGFLNGQLLIAMPHMQDERFQRVVIYICAHSDEGAMGIILNQRQEIKFPELLLQLGVINKEQSICLPEQTKQFPVRRGGPVEPSRGFVLHSDDYACETTISVTRDICLTATVDILKAMSRARGPERALFALGYAGWAAGQLEEEIFANGWLTSDANSAVLFDNHIENQYERCLAFLGVVPGFLASEAGHA
ncbi:YqgE/AlgH family protein [Bartonella sp. DGB2]|uniref:YqgE/AlgH family protein n=1 Tax=Bartonella sp. DGB2 TaxID=3388426 RepID=UPI0039902775